MDKLIGDLRSLLERIGTYINEAGKDVKNSAVPYSYIVQIGLTVNSALRLIDDSNKDSDNG